MKRLHAQILERALVLSGVPVYDGRVKSEDVHKLMKSQASDEVEVDFQHGGKNWVAVFNVLSSGVKPTGNSPETYDPGEGADVELAYFYLKSDPSAEQDPPDLSDDKLEELADTAAEYAENQEHESDESDYPEST